MKAVSIGKNIVVWDKLTDAQAKEVIEALIEVIENYRKLATEEIKNNALPITLVTPNQHLCVVKKHKEVMISTTIKTNNNGTYIFGFNYILNADTLYKSLDILRKSEKYLKRSINILEKQSYKLTDLPIQKALDVYFLTPNINPENFIKHLESKTLSEESKQFLRDVGFALENPTFSQELQSTIDAANDLFLDDERT